MGDNKKNSMSFLDKLPFMKKLKEVKHIGLIVTVIFVLILLFILFGNVNFDVFSSSKTSSTVSSDSSTYQTSAEYVEKLENKLTLLLSKVKGAGQVEVMVSVKSGASIDIAESTETKTTMSGGTEVTTVSTSPILITSNGTENPIIIAENLPKINGVVVVSSGASDINVKMYLITAVQTLLDLPQDKIQILVGK